MAKPTICMSSRHQKTPCFLWTPTLTSYAFDPFANIQKFPEKTMCNFSLIPVWGPKTETRSKVL